MPIVTFLLVRHLVPAQYPDMSEITAPPPRGGTSLVSRHRSHHRSTMVNGGFNDGPMSAYMALPRQPSGSHLPTWQPRQLLTWRRGDINPLASFKLGTSMIEMESLKDTPLCQLS
ncbi:hypothetical protein Tco_1321027 [Tanacetum coccineum]